MKHIYFLKILKLFTILFFGIVTNSNAQTMLGPGDVVIIDFNSDDDTFSFMPLVDLEVGTEIKFTDEAWLDGTGGTTLGFRGTGEDTGTYTVSGSTVARGTIISYDSASPPVTFSGNTFDGFSISGDQLLVYQGDDSSPTFIFALQTNSNVWQTGADADDTNRSSLPEGLTNDVNAIAVGSSGGLETEFDNSYYSGTTSGTYGAIAALIGHSDNWTGNDDNVYTPASSFAFTTPVTWDGSSSTDWNTTANWSSDAIPTKYDDVTIPDLANDPIIGATTNAAVNDITITSGVLSITAGGSLIVEGTSTGSFTYNVNVADMNWHLISAPVEGEQYDDAWNTANSINVSGTGLNDGVSTYDNTTDADGNWDYFQTGGAATTFNTGQGYSLLRTGAGDYAFIGTMKTTDASIAITANAIGGGGENRWTLIGNPFPSYVSIVDFLALAANATALEDSREAVYVWNGTAYVALTTGHIHPGQGFFVNSNVASTSVAINENMLSHQTGVTFYRSATTDPSIELTLSDGQYTKMTEIKYADGKTTGLDPRFDIGTFTGTSNSFHIYSHLITDSQGVDFMRQTLPNSDHENLVVPIGVNADNGANITFTANALNIPSGLHVFIEDRELGIYTQLDETNAEYSVTLSSDLNGIGRFYLHTNTQSALSTDSFDIHTVSMYKTSTTNLRIAGLQNGNASLSIFDMLGKQVLQTAFEARSINDITLPNVKTGVYIIRLSTDNGTLNKKIILNN